MLIGNIVSKSGKDYGVLTTDDIDYNADDRTFFTMYSAIMHDVKRYGFGDAYILWTERYNELIKVAEFGGKPYCLRCGEAIRYYCAQQANIKFEAKYILPDDAKWIVDWVYFEDIEIRPLKLYEECIPDLMKDMSNVEDCFAEYKIILPQVDAAV